MTVKTVKDFLECDLFNNYDYVEVRDYDDDKVIISLLVRYES